MVLGDKDLNGFKWAVLYSLGVILVMTITKSLKGFINNCLIVGWRLSLGLAMHKIYLKGNNSSNYFLVSLL